MIKASALQIVEVEKDELGVITVQDKPEMFSAPEETKFSNSSLSGIQKKLQNIVIDCSKTEEIIPASVEELAVSMLFLNKHVKNIINEFRSVYSRKSKGYKFSFQLDKMSPEEKKDVLSLLKKLECIFTYISYDAENNRLLGELSTIRKAQAFLTGKYLEIAVKAFTKDVLVGLSEKYNKVFEIYNNVIIKDKEDNRTVHEFDLVIENQTDQVYYVIEIKSGKTFKDYTKLSKIGRELGIVPDRLLLVDSYLSTEEIGVVQYFNEYWVCNIDNPTEIKDVIRKMIEADINL